MESFEGGDINEEILKSKYVLLDFYANWCGPCKLMKPIIESADEEFGDLKVLMVDVDKYSEVAQLYGVNSMPTCLLFANGQIVDRISGLIPKPSLFERIKSYIN